MKRSKHNLSHQRLHTANMGQLIPLGCVEALPGDTIQHHVNVLARVSPLAAPVMHPVTARVHHWFVPTRLAAEFLRDNSAETFDWEPFITGGPDGLDAQTIPTVSLTSTQGDLLDHLGLPQVPGVNVNALPLSAYNLIYNNFYRDQDLVALRGPTATDVALVAWEKDYFTQARPWSQKGPNITIPLGADAPVVSAVPGVAGPTFDIDTSTNLTLQGDGAGDALWSAGVAATTDAIWNNPNLIADLSNATGADVNDVRRAFALQRYQEARARYGSRYVEYLKYLGVKNPSDSRLQLPEFLGGGQTQLNFSEVLQTGQETGATQNAVGDMYGHGIAAMRSNKYRRFIEEHGYIFSLLSVRPKAIYSDAVHRMWLKQDKEDFFQKELQFIGQQEIQNNEVYADATNGDQTFGYADRYAEYREHPSGVAGEFRSTLNYWHMAREFQSAPTLNKSFIECAPTKRVFNEQTMDSLWIMAQHKMVARRIVSRNTAPRLI